MNARSTKVRLLKGSVFSHIRVMESEPLENCQTAPELYAHEYVSFYLDPSGHRVCRCCGIPEPEEPND